MDRKKEGTYDKNEVVLVQQKPFERVFVMRKNWVTASVLQRKHVSWSNTVSDAFTGINSCPFSSPIRLEYIARS